MIERAAVNFHRALYQQSRYAVPISSTNLSTLNDLGDAKKVVIEKIPRPSSTEPARLGHQGPHRVDSPAGRGGDQRLRQGEAAGACRELSGGVALIKVGAATEIEMKEKKARVEDALHATRAAIEEGVVAGGGVALIRALKALEKLEGINEDQTIGIRILARAIEKPRTNIVIKRLRGCGGHS